MMRTIRSKLIRDVFFVMMISAPIVAQENYPYPRVDAAISYEVDPSWPKRSADLPWKAVSGIAVDKNDHVYVFTRANPPVQVFDAEGNFVRAWGEDHIKTAHHIKIDHEGNIWVADIGHHVVMRFTPEGRLLRVIGTKDQPGEDETHFNKPTDMVMTPTGEVFISDGYGNNRVVHVDAQNKFVKAWGNIGQKPGEFSLPHAIAMDSKGRLYVADRNNVRVQVFDQQGKFLDEWTNVVTPWGFWVRGEDEIWICGSTPTSWKYSTEKTPLGCPPRDQSFMKFTPDGRLRQLWTIPKGEDDKEKPGDLNWVHALALDSKGNIYAGDIMGKRAQKFLRVGEKAESPR